MLAQNFMTATDLGIEEQQQEALIKTLVLLETGRLSHVRDTDGAWLGTAFEFTGHFNMDNWLLQHKCGTVGCIGGTAELVGNLKRDELELVANRNERLRGLFYPDISGDWNAITPSQAASALRSYLTTGDARWDLTVACPL